MCVCSVLSEKLTYTQFGLMNCLLVVDGVSELDWVEEEEDGIFPIVEPTVESAICNFPTKRISDSVSSMREGVSK